MLDLTKFEVLSFDCYGTLIDWEAGILSALKPVLARHGSMVADEDALALYGRVEAEVESGAFQPYAAVLRRTLEGIAAELDIDLEDGQRDALVRSLPSWQPFPDTVAALRVLARHYRLAVLSNIDEDLFEETAKRLEVAFDPVVTAESAGAYKPSRAVFDAARERIGIAAGRWLHVAQSRYHDIAPAAAFGLATVHVDRRHPRRGTGATPASAAAADLTVPDLAALAALVEPPPVSLPSRAR